MYWFGIWGLIRYIYLLKTASIGAIVIFHFWIPIIIGIFYGIHYLCNPKER